MGQRHSSRIRARGEELCPGRGVLQKGLPLKIHLFFTSSDEDFSAILMHGTPEQMQAFRKIKKPELVPLTPEEPVREFAYFV